LPAASVYFTPLVLVVRTISVIYASLNRLRQRDIKRVIAYSSIAHINLTVIGLFTATIQGVEGALLQIFSHGIVSGGLFLCIGIIYDRYHTRLIKNYSGLYQIIPIFGRIFLFLTIARIALPGTSSFVGEYLIFQGSLNLGIFLVILNTCSIVLCGCYAL
jgi:NADH:ubiquinone oxidoreductase subunit 4 (subunit M)